MDVGRLCMKLAGRDAKQLCVVIDVLDDNFVMIDGQTRRKRCNISHLEPLSTEFKLKRDASHQEVVKVLEDAGIKVAEKKAKVQTAVAKPKQIRKAKAVKASSEVKKK